MGIKKKNSPTKNHGYDVSDEDSPTPPKSVTAAGKMTAVADHENGKPVPENVEWPVKPWVPGITCR